jgi:hypothetical protein
MAVTFLEIAKYMERDFRWMRESVRKSFDIQQNVSTITQVCCYTEALSRFWAGTTVEIPTDGPRVFCDFMRKYFCGFGGAASALGHFYINKDRGKPGGRPLQVDAYEAFYYLYRHGLVHEYLQKAGSFITRTSDDGPLPYLRIRPNPRGVVAPDKHRTKRLHVHLDPLVADFSEAVGEFSMDLLTRTGKRKLQAKCRERYSFILR